MVVSVLYSECVVAIYMQLLGDFPKNLVSKLLVRSSSCIGIEVSTRNLLFACSGPEETKVWRWERSDR